MKKSRIQDDLYDYVNGEWLENAVIPDDEPTAGGFAELNKQVEELMIKEFQDMSASGIFPDENVRKAVTFFDIARNTDRRNSEGIKPVQGVLDTISSLKDIADFNAHLKDFVLGSYPLPFSINLDEDMMDTSRWCVQIQGPSTILPDVTWYRPEMAERKEQCLAVFRDMADKVLSKTSLSEEERGRYITDTLAFDELFAAYVKSSEEWSEYVKAYNPYEPAKAAALFGDVAFEKLTAALFPVQPDKIIVTEPRYFENFTRVFNADTFALYKHWAYLKALLDAADLLTEELRETGTMYRRALSGINAVSALDKYAYYKASGQFSEPVGLYYGRKYFGEEAKKDITELVQETIEAYKERIAKNEILSEATKKKAILKLSTMGLKLGYPDKAEDIYDKLVVDESKSLYENMNAILTAKRVDRFSKYGSKTDHSIWAMPGHMVNACYYPTFNDITFPAAILQAPFYSIKQTRSENLGGIGAVIAHEISHGFDNNGAQFDENGNLCNWWTEEDNRNFQKKTEEMVAQFDGYELPWGKVNGRLVVSENIADNGGIAATLQVMKKTEGANYQEYFINWARVWCLKAKDEYRKLLLSCDVHSPAVVRANMPPRNFAEWYEAFDVKEGDGMYLSEDKRVIVW